MPSLYTRIWPSAISRKYAEEQGVIIHTAEYTINQSLDFLLDGILRERPDLVGFSCYLWNIEMVHRLAVLLKKVRPDLRIILGGPEVSYDSKEILGTHPAIDYVL